MTKTIIRACIVLLILVTHSAHAITIISDDRRAGRAEPFGEFATWSNDGQAGVFDSPYHQSLVTSDLISGMGSGGILPFDGVHGSVYSSLFVLFSVDTPTYIELGGILASVGAGSAQVSSSMTLVDEFYQTLFSVSHSTTLFGEPSEEFFSFVTLLQPGQYRMYSGASNVITYGNEETSLATWEFSAEFTPVPIPAVGWLMGVFCLALFRHAAFANNTHH